MMLRNKDQAEGGRRRDYGMHEHGINTSLVSHLTGRSVAAISAAAQQQQYVTHNAPPKFSYPKGKSVYAAMYTEKKFRLLRSDAVAVPRTKTSAVHGAVKLHSKGVEVNNNQVQQRSLPLCVHTSVPVLRRTSGHTETMERYNESLEKMKPVDLDKVSNEDKLVSEERK